LTEYRAELESFITSAFPSRYQTAATASLDIFLAKPAHASYPGIPRKIWQTARTKDPDTYHEWKDQPEFAYTFMNDADANKWVHDRFAGSQIEWTWDHLTSGILKSDMLRYLLVLFEGGTYTDTDTHLLKPIDHWGASAPGNGRPSIIVGVEADVGDRVDWHDWWPRPLQICQWTISAAPFHPVLIDALRRIHDYTVGVVKWEESKGLRGPAAAAKVEEVMDKKGSRFSIMEWTGPGAFTDSVMRYLAAENAMHWPSLKDLSKPMRVHDLVVLPVTGFSPGVGLFNAGESSSPEAMVYHFFAGTWKDQNHQPV